MQVLRWHGVASCLVALGSLLPTGCSSPRGSAGDLERPGGASALVSSPLPAESLRNAKDLPPTSAPAGGVRTPAEFEPQEGILLSVPPPTMGIEAYGEEGYRAVSLYFAEVLRQARDAGVTPYLLVANEEDEAALKQSFFAAQGLSLDGIVFHRIPFDSVWTRDYGPLHVFVDGKRAIVDPKYYDDRNADDRVPSLLGDLFQETAYRPPLATEGGNFMTDGQGTCFASTRVLYQNRVYRPDIEAFDFMPASLVESHYKSYLGCQHTVFVDPVPGEGTAHIDMFAKVLDPDTLMVARSSEEWGANAQEIQHLERVTPQLEEAPKASGRWKVVRVPMAMDMPNTTDGDRTYFSYTNSLILNDRVLVPVYGRPTDALALEAYRTAMPRHKVVPIETQALIPFGGAIHCSTMQLPRP